MRRFTRGSEPAVLAENWVRWGEEWEARRIENPKAAFNWRTIHGQAVNSMLLPLLKQQTQDHCSFCDSFPVHPPSLDTIEHFRPKSGFPKQAYHWPNLYFCCMACQLKGEEFDEALLRPDAEDYSFDRYFLWDFTRGTLEVNPQASAEDRARAELTIRLYRLNDGHPAIRKMWLHRLPSLKNEPLDSLPYRHYLVAS